mmetsp:Transcript_31557/g.79675  ORF Transcript_31557/g.79675 Transcript_31557/m.79675 type:complete len:95 (-) Transcript_31557:125-409(-)
MFPPVLLVATVKVPLQLGGFALLLRIACGAVPGVPRRLVVPWPPRAPPQWPAQASAPLLPLPLPPPPHEGEACRHGRGSAGIDMGGGPCRWAAR